MQKIIFPNFLLNERISKRKIVRVNIHRVTGRECARDMEHIRFFSFQSFFLLLNDWVWKYREAPFEWYVWRAPPFKNTRTDERGSEPCGREPREPRREYWERTERTKTGILGEKENRGKATERERDDQSKHRVPPGSAAPFEWCSEPKYRDAPFK